MVTLLKDQDVFTVIVHYTVDPAKQETLINALQPGADIFAKQAGFISLTMHRSLDKSQVLVYLQWRSQADHEACMISPDFFAAGREMMALIEAGQASMLVQPYELIMLRE